MAGSVRESINEQHRGNAAATGFSRWLIDFARFVSYPGSPSPYTGMVPLGKRELSASPDGTWLSTSSPTASLQMMEEVNRSDVILSVELGGKVLEEHYITKLNFSWPQMNCVSGFPPRGSRTVLVSYVDSEDEIQKFALRFSTCDAAETFVVALKEKLKGLEEAKTQRTERSETRSDICLESVNNPFNGTNPRATEQEPNVVRPIESYVPETLLRFGYQTGQTLYTQQLQPAAEENLPNMVQHFDSYVPEILPRNEYQARQTLYPTQSAFTQIPNVNPFNLPPSFTTLLSACFPNSTPDAGKTIVKQDPDLKEQILKYMEDSSFQDMLHKVDRIIDEIGGGWIV
ncbi:unnamed protein product [Cochlearia groenlandica]